MEGCNTYKLFADGAYHGRTKETFRRVEPRLSLPIT